jgi:hypothetical protein
VRFVVSRMVLRRSNGGGVVEIRLTSAALPIPIEALLALPGRPSRG